MDKLKPPPWWRMDPQHDYATCIYCKETYNISAYQRIPIDGYVCPDCERRIRLGQYHPVRNAKAPCPAESQDKAQNKNIQL